MKRGSSSLWGARFGMDVNSLNDNRTSATTVTSYRPPGPYSKRVGEGEKLALVIPALHEARNLYYLLPRVCSILREAGAAWEMIVVDDHSRDGTEEIVGAMARREPRIRLMVRHGESGLSGAILHGWRHTDATILGAMDADGQHPPEILTELIACALNGCDLAIASRYAKGGRCGWNPLRRLASMIAITAARPLQPERFRARDPLSGFFLVRRRCVENISFQTSGFKLLLEILVRGRISAVGEVPFAFGKRRSGRSKLSMRVAWDYALLLARLFRAKYGSIRVAQQAQGD